MPYKLGNTTFLRKPVLANTLAPYLDPHPQRDKKLLESRLFAFFCVTPTVPNTVAPCRNQAQMKYICSINFIINIIATLLTSSHH